MLLRVQPRLVRFTAPLALSLALAMIPVKSHAQISRENQLKAAILVKFLGFIEWPELEDEPGSRSRSICMVGADPFGDSLERLARAQTGGAYSISIVHPDNLKNATCHLVFIGDVWGTDLRRLLRDAREKGAVTVSDMPGFANFGGTIELVEDGPYIRFIINNPDSPPPPYRLSAQLLSLAKDVLQRNSYGTF